MKRKDMINIIGSTYVTSNVENDEFSYEKAYKEKGLVFKPIKYGKKSANGKDIYAQTLDIRFEKDNVSVLIETKTEAEKEKTSVKQLDAYVQYEKELHPENKIVAILANTSNDTIRMWINYVSDETEDYKHISLLPIDEYIDIFIPKINDKEKVVQNTYNLNEELDKAGIKESIRSQFVGTCLLALKYGLDYQTSSLSTKQIIEGIREKLEGLLQNSLNKAEKLSLLDKKVLDDQAVRTMDVRILRDLLGKIDTGILPYINEKSTAGQDLLNLFFTTFNKYVNKEDKNQAFTPDHICDFMTKLTQVTHKSRVLDPCCGSGSFLVRAMTAALNDSDSEATASLVKRDHIFGIEYSEDVFGLSTTNMLLHSDGNSNVVRDSCFEREDWIIETARPTVVLMNPPYNGQKSVMPKEYTKTWGSSTTRDPSKGFYFVNFIANAVNKVNGEDSEHIAKMAVLLPVSCAIGTSSEITEFKRKMLLHNTLDAVFSLPGDMFYPGASAVACCMLFTLGKPHFESIKEVEIKDKKGNTKGYKYVAGEPNSSTFFGFCRDDGFKKKKNLGRIEQVDPNTGKSKWDVIEKEWLDLYKEKKTEIGKSAVKKVSWNDEWLAEAYMETDYSSLTEDDFQKTLNDYLSYLVKEGKVYEK